MRTGRDDAINEDERPPPFNRTSVQTSWQCVKWSAELRSVDRYQYWRMEDVEWRYLLDQLVRLEGDRLDPYRDAEGNLTVSSRDGKVRLNGERATILEEDARAVAQELEEAWPVVTRLDTVRQRVLIHMAFNMEPAGLMVMKQFVAAVEFGAWDVAADEMLHSTWGNQDRQRARTLAGLMLTGA
jgi:lysozyme